LAPSSWLKIKPEKQQAELYLVPTCCLAYFFYPEDGGRIFFRNVSDFYIPSVIIQQFRVA
jgi:hypothetical protein